MAVLFDRRRLGPAPALLVRQEDLPLPLPTVLVYHGLGADKDIQQKELVTLAEAGFLAVGIDTAGAEDWGTAMREAGGWLSRFLGPAGSG
jgi:hypothetical protein